MEKEKNMKTPTFGYTILYVGDVPKTISFYEKAFGLVKKFVTPDGDYGEMSTGTTTLSFASFGMAQSHFGDHYIASSRQGKPFGIEIALVTDDVEELMDRAITAGAQKVTKVEQKPWGQKVGYVRDPNGFLIELCTPVTS